MNPFLAAVFLSMVTAVQASPSLMIRLQAPGSKRGAQVLYLSKEGEKLYCRTQDIPEHEVTVPGLNWLKVPFENETHLESDCRRELIWREHRQCYHYGKIPLIDDLIRKCSNV